MDQLDKEFTKIRLLVSAVYGSILIYAVLIYFDIGSVSYVWEETQQILFYVLLISVPVMFVMGALIGNLIMNAERLTQTYRSTGDDETGLSAALAVVLRGSLIMAILGEAPAVYGLVLYFISGHPNYPWIFLALSCLYYPFTISRLTKARAHLEHLLSS